MHKPYLIRDDCSFLYISAYCQSLPQFDHLGYTLPNNSFVYSPDIDNEGGALLCVTDDVTCCNNSDAANWRDERGREIQQGPDGASCLYVTRGQQVISLNRKRSCSVHTLGLWRCDVPDSTGDTKSIFIYISNDKLYGI